MNFYWFAMLALLAIAQATIVRDPSSKSTVPNAADTGSTTTGFAENIAPSLTLSRTRTRRSVVADHANVYKSYSFPSENTVVAGPSGTISNDKSYANLAYLPPARTNVVAAPSGTISNDKSYANLAYLPPAKTTYSNPQTYTVVAGPSGTISNGKSYDNAAYLSSTRTAYSDPSTFGSSVVAGPSGFIATGKYSS